MVRATMPVPRTPRVSATVSSSLAGSASGRVRVDVLAAGERVVRFATAGVLDAVVDAGAAADPVCRSIVVQQHRVAACTGDDLVRAAPDVEVVAALAAGRDVVAAAVDQKVLAGGAVHMVG